MKTDDLVNSIMKVLDDETCFKIAKDKCDSKHFRDEVDGEGNIVELVRGMTAQLLYDKIDLVYGIED